MADYILIRKGRNALGSVLHVLLNLLLGVGSVVATVLTGHWLIGVLLVFLSKWRMFAVRPRFWWSNLRANLVDLAAGVSFVLLSYLAGSSWLLAHTLLAGLYSVWLIWVKPRSDAVSTEAQALTALFLGSAVLAQICVGESAVWSVPLMFLLGAGCARHVLNQRDDADFTLLAAIAGLFTAELMWLLSGWLIIYTFGDTGLRLPQVSLILTLFGFTLSRLYHSSLKHDGAIRSRDILTPVIFALGAIVLIFLFFSQPIFNI